MYTDFLSSDIFAKQRPLSRYIALFRSVKRSPFVKGVLYNVKTYKVILDETNKKVLNNTVFNIHLEGRGADKARERKKGTMTNNTQRKEKIRNTRHPPFSRHFLLSSL